MNTWFAMPSHSGGVITEHEVGVDGLTTGRTRTTYPQNYRVNNATFYTREDAKVYVDMYHDATGIRPTIESI